MVGEQSQFQKKMSCQLAMDPLVEVDRYCSPGCWILYFFLTSSFSLILSCLDLFLVSLHPLYWSSYCLQQSLLWSRTKSKNKTQIKTTWNGTKTRQEKSRNLRQECVKLEEFVYSFRTFKTFPTTIWCYINRGVCHWKSPACPPLDIIFYGYFSPFIFSLLVSSC